MKIFNLVTMVVIVISCKNDALEPWTSKNRLEATITFRSGEVREYLSTGSDVEMGCGLDSYILSHQSPAAIYIGVFNGYRCVTAPGTYYYHCDYYPNKNSQLSPVYMGYSTPKQGRITYTVVDGKYVEGHFEAVSKTGLDAQGAADSVWVKGTFSGFLK